MHNAKGVFVCGEDYVTSQPNERKMASLVARLKAWNYTPPRTVGDHAYIRELNHLAGMIEYCEEQDDYAQWAQNDVDETKRLNLTATSNVFLTEWLSAYIGQPMPFDVRIISIASK